MCVFDCVPLFLQFLQLVVTVTSFLKLFSFARSLVLRWTTNCLGVVVYNSIQSVSQKKKKNKDFLLDAAPFSLFFLFRIPVAVAVDAADDSVVC